MTNQLQHNPLLQEFSTLYHTYPFPEITVKNIEDAIFAGIKEEKEEINRIVNNDEAPTFQNTIEALECSGETLSLATTLMYNQLSANTNDELEELSQRMASILSEHHSEIMQNEALFQRVKQVYHAEKSLLSGEDLMLLEQTYVSFERSGATLDAEKKKRFREIKSELSELSLKFSQNHLRATNEYVLHITNKEDLQGLPESQVEQARQTAEEKQLQGWCFTLHAPSFIPFMKYADNRELRRQMYMAYHTQCATLDELSNFDIVVRLVNLRRELAQLLGYAHFAAYVLKRRMAETPEHVYALLNQLLEAYMPVAREEVAQVEEYAKKEQGETFELQPWDFAYYSHQLKKTLYHFDEEMLRPYFELSSVVKGVFSLAERLYGITFVKNKEIPVYHPDVDAYEVYDNDGKFLAVLYTDFHPRDSKRGGAWMTNYREASAGERPHVAVVMNFTKATATRPALLTHAEVETFLHEFGHALHGIFGATKHRSLSGTNVYWDFVELPSQFMENFAVEKDFLQTFARHYVTNEKIPNEMVERIIQSRNFQVGYACVRQLSFGLLDMAYYTMKNPFQEDVISFEKKEWESIRLLPEVKETCMTVQFEHIMTGGYSAGYYSYKWAEVLDADAFSLFQEEGVFNRDVATKFRKEILEKGGTEHPMHLYRAFRGRQPNITALLKRSGIDNNK